MKNKNWTYIVAVAIVYAFMIGALGISFSHIIHAGALLGLIGWQAFTAPFFIDGFMVLGRLGRSHKFTPETREIGKRLQLAATLLSLAANIYAGETTGERIYGALVVVGFITAEWFAEKLRPAQAAEPTPAAKRSAAAQKGAATRKANAAKKAQQAADRAARRRAARDAKEMQDAFDNSIAPVSPAPVG